MKECVIFPMLRLEFALVYQAQSMGGGVSRPSEKKRPGCVSGVETPGFPFGKVRTRKEARGGERERRAWGKKYFFFLYYSTLSPHPYPLVFTF